MNLARFQRIIKWWTENGSINLNHLEKVLEAKEKPFTPKEKKLLVRTINAN